jgi:hypothetical protein
MIIGTTSQFGFRRGAGNFAGPFLFVIHSGTLATPTMPEPI